MTIIHDTDRTYVLPPVPMLCFRCGAMSGIFINRFGGTVCCRCDVEERNIETGKEAA